MEFFSRYRTRTFRGAFSGTFRTTFRRTFSGTLSPQGGFTLLELIVVLVVIGILSAIAMPRMNVSSYRMDAAMRGIQSALQQAQRNAVQSQNTVIVSFDTARHEIRLVTDLNGTNQPDDGEPVRLFPIDDAAQFGATVHDETGVVQPAVSGTRISTSSDGLPTVYFRRSGSVSSTFKILIRSRTDRGGGPEHRLLKVSQATGRVELMRHGSEGRWHIVRY